MQKWSANQNSLRSLATCFKICTLLIELNQKTKESQRKQMVFQLLLGSLRLLSESLSLLLRCILTQLLALNMLKKLTESSRSLPWMLLLLACQTAYQTPQASWQTSPRKSRRRSRGELLSEPRSPIPSCNKKWWWDLKIRELLIMLLLLWLEKETLSIKSQERSSAERWAVHE